VLVVGTTPDYVDIINKSYPGRAVFLTEGTLRERAREEAPEAPDEIVADLGNIEETLSLLSDHLKHHGISLSGITSYDDESLIITARIAACLKLPFPDEKSVRISRSKFHSKRIWAGAGVPCPRVQLCRDRESLETVMDRVGFPFVLKPLTGSGSELVFFCRKREEARSAFGIITRRLAVHPDIRLYSFFNNKWGPDIDPRRDVVAEEGTTGPEFSCDFILAEHRSRVIRYSGKILAPQLGTGTTYIYYVPEKDEIGITRRDLERQLTMAAESLGFKQGLFMADFICHRGKPSFFEISPRVAGDCIPWLVKASGDVDTLGLALDAAEGKPIRFPDPDLHRELAAVRIFSRKPGLLKEIDTGRLQNRNSVLDIMLYRSPGHRITLPPDEYFSRIIGHILYRPGDRFTIPEEGAELENLVRLEVTP
jgi:biotin carboxylase